MNAEQQKTFIEIWEEFCKRADQERCCQADNLIGSQFRDHFEEYHLSFY